MMTSRRRFMAMCFGLAAWFWCTTGVNAQEPAASPQPKDAGRPASVVVPSDIPWDTIEWVERRYKIEAIRFKALDETGVDWWGSDEVMIGTDDAKGWTVSDEIGNIDSGDTHNFDPAKSCIVAVRPGVVVLGRTSMCDDFGEPAPLGFRVEFWEKDWGLYPGFCAGGGEPPPGHHRGPIGYCGPNDGNGDDFIGGADIDYSTQELEAALPKVGDEIIETVVLSPCLEGVCTVGWGPWDSGEYTFTWRVTRLPDARVDLRSVLDEAMQRSGARSELEAIAAGLRALRAPSPRQIKPEQ